MYTGTRPGSPPPSGREKGWRGRRELAPRCSATQLGAFSLAHIDRDMCHTSRRVPPPPPPPTLPPVALSSSWLFFVCTSGWPPRRLHAMERRGSPAPCMAPSCPYDGCHGAGDSPPLLRSTSEVKSGGGAERGRGAREETEGTSHEDAAGSPARARTAGEGSHGRSRGCPRCFSWWWRRWLALGFRGSSGSDSRHRVRVCRLFGTAFLVVSRVRRRVGLLVSVFLSTFCGLLASAAQCHSLSLLGEGGSIYLDMSVNTCGGAQCRSSPSSSTSLLWVLVWVRVVILVVPAWLCCGKRCWNLWDRRCVWMEMRGTRWRTGRLKRTCAWRNGQPYWIHHCSRGNCARAS